MLPSFLDELRVFRETDKLLSLKLFSLRISLTEPAERLGGLPKLRAMACPTGSTRRRHGPGSCRLVLARAFLSIPPSRRTSPVPRS